MLRVFGTRFGRGRHFVTRTVVLVEFDVGAEGVGQRGVPLTGGQSQRLLGRVDGFREPAGLGTGGGQGGQRRRVSSVAKPHRPPGQVHGFGPVADRGVGVCGKRPGDSVQQIEIVRVRLEQFTLAGQCVDDLLPLGDRRVATRAGMGMGGIFSQSLVELVDRLIVAPESDQDIAQVVVGPGVVRLDFHRLQVIRDRLAPRVRGQLARFPRRSGHWRRPV